jgi:hypothetical protein
MRRARALNKLRNVERQTGPSGDCFASDRYNFELKTTFTPDPELKIRGVFAADNLEYGYVLDYFHS